MNSDKPSWYREPSPEDKAAMSAPEPLPENKTLTTGLPVRIKGLAWSGDDYYGSLKAESPFGWYSVWRYSETIWRWKKAGEVFSQCESMQHGQQFCQQDFEKRLREWIVTPDDGKESV